VKTDDKIVVDAPNKIEFLSQEIHLKGTKKVVIGEGAAKVTIDNETNKITSDADKITATAVTLHELKSLANMKMSAPHHQTEGNTEVMIKGTSIKVDGGTTTDIKGGMVNLNC
jgi:hypothetical protein